MRGQKYIIGAAILKGGNPIVDTSVSTIIARVDDNRVNTVQEYLLARIIFGEYVCEKQWADFIMAI